MGWGRRARAGGGGGEEGGAGCERSVGPVSVAYSAPSGEARAKAAWEGPPSPVRPRVREPSPALPPRHRGPSSRGCLPSVCLRPSLPSGCVSAAGRLPPVGLRLTLPPRSVRLSQDRPPSFSPVGVSVSGPPILFVSGLPGLLYLWSTPFPPCVSGIPKQISRSPLLRHSFPTSVLLRPFCLLCVCLRMPSPSPHRASVSLGHLPSFTPTAASLAASSLLDCTTPHSSHDLLPNVASGFGGLCSLVCPIALLPLTPPHSSASGSSHIPFFSSLPLQPP